MPVLKGFRTLLDAYPRFGRIPLQSGEVITIKPSDKLNSVNVQQFIKAK